MSTNGLSYIENKYSWSNDPACRELTHFKQSATAITSAARSPGSRNDNDRERVVAHSSAHKMLDCPRAPCKYEEVFGRCEECPCPAKSMHTSLIVQPRPPMVTRNGAILSKDAALSYIVCLGRGSVCTRLLPRRAVGTLFSATYHKTMQRQNLHSIGYGSTFRERLHVR